MIVHKKKIKHMDYKIADHDLIRNIQMFGMSTVFNPEVDLLGSSRGTVAGYIIVTRIIVQGELS